MTGDRAFGGAGADIGTGLPGSMVGFGAAGRAHGGGRCDGVLWRELAGGPEQEDLFEPAEDSGEAGHDEGVQGGRQPTVGVVRLGGLP